MKMMVKVLKQNFLYIILSCLVELNDHQTEELLIRQRFASKYKINGEMRKCWSYTFDPLLIYLLQEHSFIIKYIILE